MSTVTVAVCHLPINNAWASGSLWSLPAVGFRMTQNLSWPSSGQERQMLPIFLVFLMKSIIDGFKHGLNMSILFLVQTHLA